MVHRPAIDPSRWRQLSPLLDELMELDDPSRSARLQALRTTDPLAATELEALLGSMQSARDEHFLEQRAAGLPDSGADGGLGPGTACGAWTLMHPLGTGGMGTVWLARRTDGRYDAQAAIKLPHPGVLSHGGAERFEREGRLLARLSHPHIAALLDAGVAASGQPYLVLEAVHGMPIDRHCDERLLTIEARIALFLDVLSAVAHAHGHFVLHRDLKPSNILIDEAGRVKLLDFGIARLIDVATPAAGDAAEAGASTRIFTPDHASPEQLQGRAVGVPADIYALGVLLYQLLASCHPTARPTQTPLERLKAVAETVPPAVSEAARGGGEPIARLRSTTLRRLVRRMRGDLDTVVAKALKKDPAERYASAAALADDLRRWRDGWPVLAQPERLAHRVRLAVRRHRAVAFSGLVAAMLLIAGVVGIAWQAQEARRERDEARWQAERAQARSTLLNLALGQMGALDAPLTQRQILDGAVRLVEARFGTNPRVAVELLLPIAGQYHTMGDVQADLDVMRIAARQAAASGDAELVATVACSTVDTYVYLDRLPDAEAALAAASAAIGRIASPSPSLQATCWRYEAELAMEYDQRQRALAAALRAVQRLESTGGTTGNTYTALLSLLIHAHRGNGDMASALATADRLAGLHRAESGGRSLDAAIVDHTRALMFADAGEIAAAHRLETEVVARFGAGGPPPFVLYGLARLELGMGLTAAAEATAQRAAGSAERRGASGAAFHAQIAHLHAQVALADDRIADARRWFEQSLLASGRRAMRSVVPTADTVHAMLLLAEGRTAAAVKTIDAELTRLQQADVAHLEKRAQAWRTASEIRLAAGDATLAAAHARAALDASTRAARDPAASARVGHARLLLAKALRASGDAAAAREEAARAAGSLERGAGRDHPLAVTARALAAPSNR